MPVLALAGVDYCVPSGGPVHHPAPSEGERAGARNVGSAAGRSATLMCETRVKRSALNFDF